MAAGLVISGPGDTALGANPNDSQDNGRRGANSPGTGPGVRGDNAIGGRDGRTGREGPEGRDGGDVDGVGGRGGARLQGAGGGVINRRALRGLSRAAQARARAVIQAQNQAR